MTDEFDLSNPRPAEDRSIFDPKAVRVLSVLPDVDVDEAYCVRHDREMTEVEIVAFYYGAEYELADDFHGFTCEQCAAALGQKASVKPVEIIRAYGKEMFTAWDDGESPGNWFVFVQEREDAPSDPDDIRINILRTEDIDD